MSVSGHTITPTDASGQTTEESTPAVPVPVPALTAVLVDPTAGPADLDAVAAAHRDLRLPAKVIAAIRRISAGEGDADIADVLTGIVDEAPAQDVERAIRVLQRVPPSTDVIAACVALYSAAGRYDAVLAVTHGLTDVDDRAALSLVYRATAMAGVGLWTGAQEIFTTVLRRRWHAAVRELARRQRTQAFGG